MTTEATPTTQLHLMPTSPVLTEAGRLPVSLLPPDDQLPSPPPSKALTASVRLLGVLDPITVAYVEAGYRVVDGRRRLKAARLAGLHEVPVVHVRGLGDQTVSSLSVHAHATRSANPLSDLHALHTLIDALVREGKLNDREIVSEVARSTGLAVGTVKARMNLLKLESAFRDAIRRGDLTIGLAERIAKLPGSRRDRLAETLEEKGRLTEADLKAEVSKGATEAVAQFDWDQIDAVPPARVQVPFSVLAPIAAVLSGTFDNWSMDEATGTFVVSDDGGPVYRITVVQE